MIDWFRSFFNIREGIVTRLLVKFLVVSALVLGITADFQAWGGDQPTEDEKSAVDMVLGLPELEQMALASSSSLARARLETQASEDELARAKAALLPQFDVLALTGPVNDAEVPFVENGEIVSRTDRNDYSSINVFVRLELAVTQPLYTFGKISNRRDAADLNVEIHRSKEDQEQSRLLRDVRLRYYGLVLAQMGEAAAVEAFDFLEDLETRVDRLLEAGSINVRASDRYRLQAFRGEMEENRARLKAARNKSYLALKTLAGLPRERDFVVKDRELPGVEMESQDELFYVQAALRQRPELHQLEKGVEAKRRLWEAAESDLYPDIFAAVHGAVARAPGRDRFDDPYINDGFNEEYVGVVLGAKWHFDLGVTSGERDRAKSEYLALQQQKQDAYEKIALQTAAGYQDLLKAADSVKAFETSTRAARKWLVTAMSGFDMGIDPVSEVIEALEQYGRSRGGYLLNLYEFHATRTELWYTTGLYFDRPDSNGAVKHPSDRGAEGRN